MFNNDVLLSVQPYLRYRDLVSLSFTCKDMDSLVNDVAKQIVTKNEPIHTLSNLIVCGLEKKKSLKKHDTIEI